MTLKKINHSAVVKAIKSAVQKLSKNLDIYRKWIERRLEGVRDTEVYNTGDGAEIKGAVLVKDFMSLRL